MSSGAVLELGTGDDVERLNAGETVVVRRGGVILGVCFHFPIDHLPTAGKGVGRLPRKNVYYAPDRKRGGLYRTELARKFAKALQAKAERLGLETHTAKSRKHERPVRSGWWRLELLVVMNRKRTTLDVLVPDIDSDACLSPAKDALQYAGILDDDGRIVEDRTTAVYGESQALHLRLRRLFAEEVDTATAAWGKRYFGFR